MNDLTERLRLKWLSKMAAKEVAGHTMECKRHGQYIGTIGNDSCPVCAGIPKGKPKGGKQGGVKDRLQNRSRGEVDPDDWEYV